MDGLGVLAAKQACSELVGRYAKAVNEWDLDVFVSLFTDDGIWSRPASGEARGRAAIRSVMESQPTSSERVVRHVNGAMLIDVSDDTHATGWSQTTVYVARTSPLPVTLTGPDMVVEYVDRYLRDLDAGWLFESRITTIVFQADRPTSIGSLI